MPRYLLIANETLGGEDLLDHLTPRVGDDTSFYVLVPMSEPEHPTVSGVAGGGAGSTTPTAAPDATPTAADELSPADAARQRLDEAIAQLKRLGAQVEGDVTTEDPVEAAHRAFTDDTFDEVIVATPPPGPSHVLNRDVVSQIEGRVDVPVDHVFGPRGDVRAAE